VLLFALPLALARGVGAEVALLMSGDALMLTLDLPFIDRYIFWCKSSSAIKTGTLRKKIIFRGEPRIVR